MSKKIQISSVELKSDVQVIFVNANLISRAIKADIALNNLIETAKANGCIIPRYETEVDENCEPKVDERGCLINRPVIDEKTGEQVIDYSSFRMENDELRTLCEKVAPFLRELVDAFEE